MPYNRYQKPKYKTGNKEANSAKYQEKLKEFYNTIKEYTEEERQAILSEHKLTTVEGHQLSENNALIILLQLPSASITGTYNQWLRNGRQVLKEERKNYKFITGASFKALNKDIDDLNNPNDKEKEQRFSNFYPLRVYDISQTQEYKEGYYWKDDNLVSKLITKSDEEESMNMDEDC